MAANRAGCSQHERVQSNINEDEQKGRTHDMSEFSHLDELEAEAIYIIREVAAECEKPVMLYFDRKRQLGYAAPGNESFLSGETAVPVFARQYTTWKFKEMIEFRDRTSERTRHRYDRVHQRGRG